MEQTRSFRVPNMCCETCVAWIRHCLAELPGVGVVRAAIDTRCVTVECNAPTHWRDIERHLDVHGYPPGPPLA